MANFDFDRYLLSNSRQAIEQSKRLLAETEPLLPRLDPSKDATQTHDASSKTSRRQVDGAALSTTQTDNDARDQPALRAPGTGAPS